MNVMGNNSFMDDMVEAIRTDFRNRYKAKIVMKKTISKVVSGEISDRVFFSNFYYNLMKNYVKDAIYAAGICLFLNLEPKFILMYGLAKAAITLGSTAKLFYDEYKKECKKDCKYNVA